ncbi:MAG TPA: YlxR family protein [Dermatophilaceae bacterium]|nr:YlxR family protein [Dermatophilaceae bacterium]
MAKIGSPRSTRQPDTHLPTRMCVGCRRRDDRSALLRVVGQVRADGDVVVVVDPRRRLPGRGAWVHPDPSCVERAIRRSALVRALRLGAAPVPDELVDWIRREGAATHVQDTT